MKLNLFTVCSITLKVAFLFSTLCQFFEFLLYAVIVSLTAEKKEGKINPKLDKFGIN